MLFRSKLDELNAKPVAFLSTPPSRVATLGRQYAYAVVHVSIHATLAGGDFPVPGFAHSFFRFLSTPPSRVATPPGAPPLWRLVGFYPRHPRGWRRMISLSSSKRQIVSIHATLAGGDRGPSRTSPSVVMFLSTPPSRVATTIKGYKVIGRIVSIHATLAGGDQNVEGFFSLIFRFLSTPPSRVATLRLFLF